MSTKLLNAFKAGQKAHEAVRAKAASDRYVLIGGSPFRGYNSTLTYTHLKIVGTAPTLEDVKKLAKAKYESCGGLLLAVDTETGQEVEWG